MNLYTHSAIWKNNAYMPKSYYCNGYIMVNNEKMSKSKGNFYTLENIVKDYGADASRFALADCGDGMDDANFVLEIADSAVNRIFIFEKFVQFVLKSDILTIRINLYSISNQISKTI